MPSKLQGLDVLVLPSVSQPNWTEQFGRILIEAMACGAPVVATGTGGSREFLRDGYNCVVFHAGDPRALIPVSPSGRGGGQDPVHLDLTGLGEDQELVDVEGDDVEPRRVPLVVETIAVQKPAYKDVGMRIGEPRIQHAGHARTRPNGAGQERAAAKHHAIHLTLVKLPSRGGAGNSACSRLSSRLCEGSDPPRRAG